MKKELLFIVFVFIGHLYGYGQVQAPYTQVASISTLGTINDIYIAKVPNSTTDSIYLSVQDTGVYTTQISLSSLTKKIGNQKSNLNISIEDFFNSGNPDLMVSHHTTIGDNPTNHFSFYQNLTNIPNLNSSFPDGPAGLLKWKKMFNDSIVYLLFATSGGGNENYKTYQLTNTGLGNVNNLSNSYNDVTGEFMNARNNGKIDIISTGTYSPSSFGYSNLRKNENLNSTTNDILGSLGYQNAKIIAGDIDGDGWEDIVVMGIMKNENPSRLSRSTPGGVIAWFKNNGNGENPSFSRMDDIASVSTITISSEMFVLGDFALGDFNYDGKMDICIADNGNLKFFLNNGNSDNTAFISGENFSFGTSGKKHRIGLFVNYLGNSRERCRLDIFVSSDKTLYRFSQQANNTTHLNTIRRPQNLSIATIGEREDFDGETIGQDITVTWSKVDKAVSYDGYMKVVSADGSRSKVLLHKSIPLAIHGNLGNGNIEGSNITDTKKAKFFVPQDVYTSYPNGIATISIWSIDGAYRRSTDSATISIVLPPNTPTPPPLPPTDSICPDCPNDTTENGIYRRPRVRMASATSRRNDSPNVNFDVTLKGTLTSTGWSSLTNAGFYISANRDTIENLNFGRDMRTLPVQNTSERLYRVDFGNAGRIVSNMDTIINNIQSQIPLSTAITYYVRAFAQNTHGPTLSNSNNIKTFILRPQGTITPPTPPDTDTLPGIEEDSDGDGEIDITRPLPELQSDDVPIFYKRFQQGYPYQMVNDRIQVNSESRPVRLDFKEIENLYTPPDTNYIKGNKTFRVQNDDSVVLITKKVLPHHYSNNNFILDMTGLMIPVTARGYDVSGNPRKNLIIFPKYRLQQHLASKKRTFNRDTVILRKGSDRVPTDDRMSAVRVDTLTILLDPASIPNRQKSIALDSFPAVSSTYKVIKAFFPTVDTSYIDAIPQNLTTYRMPDGNRSGRFEIDGLRNLKYLPRDTTFRIFVENSGNAFFKTLRDEIFVRIITRALINTDSLPTPPGIDDDEVTVVVPNPDGSIDTVQITGFPTDGVRIFFQNQNNPYFLSTRNVSVTTTRSTSDGGIISTTVPKRIQFSSLQTEPISNRYTMSGNSITMNDVNTVFAHTSPYTISYIHRDSIWIETIEDVGRTQIRRKVPLYIIPKQIYDYKVVKDGNPIFTPSSIDRYGIVADTISILKRSTLTTGNTELSIDFTFSKDFHGDQKKYLYRDNDIHQGEVPRFSDPDPGSRLTSIDVATPRRLRIKYPNGMSSGTAYGTVKFKGDSITFFKKTERNLIIKVRKFDSIRDNILDNILLNGSVLEWCTQSLTDSIHRVTANTPKTILQGTTIAGRNVKLEVLPEYRHIIQLIAAVPAIANNPEARNIKMLDTGQVVIRAYVNDDPAADLPALEQLLRFRVIACQQAISNSNVDWITPSADTVMSTLFRDEFELKAIVRQLPNAPVRYEITDGFDFGHIRSGNRLKLQGTIGDITIKASYAGSVFYRPDSALLYIWVRFIKKKQIVVESPEKPECFISSTTVKAPPEGEEYNFVLKELFHVKDSLSRADRTNEAKLHVEMSAVPINGRVIQEFPNRNGDPILDSLLFRFYKPVGVPVRLTVRAKEDSLYYESQPYVKNILIIGDKQDPSLILPEYPGKDCFDVNAELKKHYVDDYTYVDIAIYNRYGTNVMNTSAKRADETCLQEIQKLPDGVYLCVLFVDGNKSQPYCSYITILRSK